MAALRGNAIVGQAGGPTAVINQSLVGLIEAARPSAQIERFFGARHGVCGILGEQFIDLYAESPATLDAVARTPSAALGSVRKKPTADECLQMFEVMRRHGVRYFFYIGGNDSAETVFIVNEMAREAQYELRCFHVPKTVDNDLRVTDHSPGYGSAARFVASAFIGDDLDNRALPGVKIDVVMGRHAGFLTAASALGRVRDDDGPHLIYLPERPITREQFITEVASVYDRLGRCVVAVSEGIVDAGDPDGRTFTEVISAEAAEIERDTHGNVQLSGSGLLGDWLANQLRAALGGRLRVRADTFGYLQRAFPGAISAVDAAEARQCGRKAVEFATVADVDGSVAIIRTTGDGAYAVEYRCVPLQEVARATKTMPDEFIAASGNHITPAFIDYAAPLTGPLPVVGRLEGMG